MASSSVAGLPSMVATGRSSTWWLRNHALPRTQAFFALVMWLFSTVNSMSSQTQPQKVQVALLTTLSSLADMQAVLFTGSVLLRLTVLGVSVPKSAYADCHTSNTN